MTQPRTTFHLYGRKEYDRPLEYVTLVVVDDAASLRQTALQQTGGHDWVELIAIPASAIVRVAPPEESL